MTKFHSTACVVEGANSSTSPVNGADVVDTTLPVITLLGDNPISVEVGSNYTDAGAIACDDMDGDITQNIVVDDSKLDISAIGHYNITYNVIDSEGKSAQEIVRTVNVLKALPPKHENGGTPLLIILLDFSDTDFANEISNPEDAWSSLIFGTNKGQGNHYWDEVSRGQFQLLKASESYGTPNNGVIRIKVSSPKPKGSEKYLVEDQGWIRDALDIAGNYIDFAEYDYRDINGRLTNDELSILFVLNMSYFNIKGAGAQANILIKHVVDDIEIVEFARTMYDYTSIGVNMHELGHHIFNLTHFVWPTFHGLMGMGAYNEDPIITMLTSNSHHGTSPAHLIGFNKWHAGFVEPTLISSTRYSNKLYSSHSYKYNLIAILVVDGYLYLEYRPKEGYDAVIDFCNNEGGIFGTEVSQYIKPYRISGEYDYYENYCDYYSFPGNNESFNLGGFDITITAFSEDDFMTLDIVDTGVDSIIDYFAYEYWVPDPNRPGYRMRQQTYVADGTNPVIDFAKFVDGDNPTGSFPMFLQSFYNTGEQRNENSVATFSTESNYLTIRKSDFTNPFCYRQSVFVDLSFNTNASYESTTKVLVDYQGLDLSFTLINLP